MPSQPAGKKLDFLERRIAVLKEELQRAERGTRARKALHERLRALQQKKRSMLGGLSRVARRQQPLRDARIAQAYYQAPTKYRVVQALAAAEGLSTKQVRRIAKRMGPPPALSVALPVEPDPPPPASPSPPPPIDTKVSWIARVRALGRRVRQKARTYEPGSPESVWLLDMSDRLADLEKA